MRIQPRRNDAGQAAIGSDVARAAWLERIRRADAAQARELIAARLDRLRSTRLPAAERFQVVEDLRERVCLVLGELAQRYENRSVPLSIAEFAVWNSVVELWQAMHLACEQCLLEYRSGDRSLEGSVALVCLRSIRYSAETMQEHYRARREIPAQLWRQLHCTHLFAHARGVASVALGAGRPGDGSCLAAYANALLAHAASPYSLSFRQQEVVRRWLDQWEHLPGYFDTVPAEGIGSAFVIDPFGEAGLQRMEVGASSPPLHYLQVDGIAQELRRTLGLLRKGHAPDQLGLGSDVRPGACEKLLTLLYIQWCSAGTGLINVGTSVIDRVSTAIGIAAIHACVSGAQFRAPGTKRTAQEATDLLLFGRVTDRTRRAQEGPRADRVESWDLVGRSGFAFLDFVRRADLPGGVRHLGLVLVQNGNGTSKQLGVVQRMMIGSGVEQFLGVRLMPGSPRAIAVNASDAVAGSPGFQQALALPAVPELQVPATLLLPAGVYGRGRVVEVREEGELVVKLGALIEQGDDFDRMEFTIQS